MPVEGSRKPNESPPARMLATLASEGLLASFSASPQCTRAGCVGRDSKTFILLTPSTGTPPVPPISFYQLRTRSTFALGGPLTRTAAPNFLRTPLCESFDPNPSSADITLKGDVLSAPFPSFSSRFLRILIQRNGASTSADS